jgi:hypothetical protein
MLPEAAGRIDFGILVALSHIYGKMGVLKTTVEIPDALFRKAKATAAERGISLKNFFSNAIRDHLARSPGESIKSPIPDPPWRSAFGGLRHLRKENQRINRILEEEFEQIDKDQWR